MRLRTTIYSLLALACSGAASGQQATARDTFWSASDLVSVSTNPAAKSPRKSAAHTTTKGPTPRDGGSGNGGSGHHVDPVLVATNGYGEQPHLVRVSEEQIGLRYSLNLRNAEGKYEEASPATVFHGGDHLRLSVMANQPGYVYVIQQGSTGSWSPIFPASGSAQDVNRVEQGQLYQVPTGKGAFSFDQNPGQEKLFIVLSRQPIHDFDSLIQGLKQPPPSTPSMSGNGASLEASNRIPDELVQRLASRDLTLVQEVDEGEKGAGSGEKAVYVVSKGAPKAAGPEVVASVTLRHE